jgi:periplasmic protein TonB
MTSPLRLPFVALVIAAVAFASAVVAQERVYDRKDGEDITLPTVVKSVKANYTKEAMEARIQGTVTMSVIVRDDGKVGEVTVTQSLDKQYGLDDAAVNAVKQWEFRPGTKGGKPVAVRVDIEMSFQMK